MLSKSVLTVSQKKKNCSHTEDKTAVSDYQKGKLLQKKVQQTNAE